MIGIAAATCSETGQRASNEDRVGVSLDGRLWTAVLADGAGGHLGGAEASRLAVEHLQQALQEAGAGFGASSLRQAIVTANRHVLEGQKGASGLERMHSTVVVLWIDTFSGAALWAHVGDSRLYVVRRGVLRQLTTDDSVVQRMVDVGLITPEQALVHPGKNQLIAALGIEGEPDPHATTHALQLQAGDAFLLCSDGWWGSLDEGAILASLADADTPEEWLAAMRQRIEAEAQPRQDNFSAVAAWVVHEGAVEAAAPAAAVPAS